MVTVLVVDDERNLLDLVEGYLKTEGFTVVTAMDGPSAVESARQLDVMLRCGRMSCHLRTVRRTRIDVSEAYEVARRGATG